jgi:hypothetical protein
VNAGEWIGSGGLADLQNRVGDAPRGSGGFDSHTLPPRRLRAARSFVVGAALVALLLVPAGLAAQDSAAVAKPDSAAAVKADAVPLVADSGRVDSARAPSPAGAMIKSLLIPGLGQISLGRKLTAAVFVAFEGAALAMVLKSQGELSDARAESGGEDTPLVLEKARKREDWLVLMGVNHVLSGIEAYVSAHLWDFPGELQIQAVPGGVRAAASVPLRLR